MYLEERANTLKAEYGYIAGLHKEYPTTLQETYKQDAENAVKARYIADLLEKKKKEIEEFLFYHPEYADIFEGGENFEI